MSQMIVLVEDDQDIGELVQRELEKAGYLVFWRRNGYDGWDTIVSGRPHLAILDVSLPGLSGLEVLKKMKADAQTRQIPVMMASALGQQQDIVMAIRGGAVDYLVKPFSVADMRERVERVLSTQPH